MHLKGDLRPLADAILKGYEIDRAVAQLSRLRWSFDDKHLPESLKDDMPVSPRAKAPVWEERPTEGASKFCA